MQSLILIDGPGVDICHLGCNGGPSVSGHKTDCSALMFWLGKSNRTIVVLGGLVLLGIGKAVLTVPGNS